MSLRARLVSAVAAAVAISIILASVVVYLLVGRELRGQLKGQLQQAAMTIARRPPHFAIRLGPKLYQLQNTVPLVGYYQLVDASGDIFMPDDYTGLTPLPVTPRAEAAAAGRGGPFSYETEFGGAHQLVYTLPMRIVTQTTGAYGGGFPASQSAVVEVAVPLTSLDHELTRIQLLLILVSLGGIAIAAGAALLIARSTLIPVRRLSETAERVRATRNLSERITVEGDDELSRLAHTFNEMLAALDEAASRQQRLVQDASHELRTPLTSLRTNIEVLAAGRELAPDDRSQLLQDVIAQLGEMTAVIGELTELARGTEQLATFEPLSLDLVVQETVDRTLRNHPETLIEAEIEPTAVMGSATDLERAIANLLDNAAKWNPPGTAIELRLHDRELTVRDRGPGIAEADAPHVFERFYRATSARSMPGSGLGLSIVSRVAEAHGVTITVERPLGGGTLIRLRFPPLDLAAARAKPSDERDSVAAAPNGSTPGPASTTANATDDRPRGSWMLRGRAK